MNLNELGSTPLNDGVDVANLPEQMGSFTPPPPPGTYRFELPTLKPDHFQGVTSETYGKRVMVKFGDESPLKIVQAPDHAKDEYTGAPFYTTISNVPRKRGKGDNAPIAADWDYLNKALGEPKRPVNNAEYAKALIAQSNKVPKPSFQADVEWSWSCNDKRDARYDQGDGTTTTVPQLDEAQVPMTDPNTGEPVNVKGCGNRMYQAYPGSGDKGVQKVDGAYPLRVTCPKCQASVRAFPNLTRYQP